MPEVLWYQDGRTGAEVLLTRPRDHDAESLSSLDLKIDGPRDVTRPAHVTSPADLASHVDEIDNPLYMLASVRIVEVLVEQVGPAADFEEFATTTF
jgi:hypothetical protein